MVKKTSLSAASVLLISSFAIAEHADSWVPIASSNNTDYSAKKGTFKNIKGISSILVMFNNREDKTIQYYKVSIKNADCDNGFGMLKFFGMDGELLFKGDYVAEGSSVGAGVGDFICTIRIEATNLQKG